MGPATILFLLVGFVCLVAGAEALVRGASQIAARTGMSSVVIGLTVVAFGTSAPELAVSVGDALRGDEGSGSIALGNVVGSNIANILLALGIAAAVGGSLIVAQRIVRLDVPIMIGASVLVFVMALDHQLSRLEGAVLFALVIAYVSWTVITARRTTTAADIAEYDEAIDPTEQTHHAVWIDLLMVAAGLALLVVGAQLLVNSATDIAEELGVSDLVIGLTVVAIGTSLPEIATSVLAVMRGQRDIAVGNAIGSNIFNLLAVLGLTALVSPDPLRVPESAIQVDLPVMVAVAVACLPIFATGYVLRRWEGIAFLGYYVAYVVWLVVDANDHDVRNSYGLVMVYFVVPITAMTIAVIFVRYRRQVMATAH